MLFHDTAGRNGSIFDKNSALIEDCYLKAVNFHARHAFVRCDIIGYAIFLMLIFDGYH